MYKKTILSAAIAFSLSANVFAAADDSKVDALQKMVEQQAAQIKVMSKQLRAISSAQQAQARSGAKANTQSGSNMNVTYTKTQPGDDPIFEQATSEDDLVKIPKPNLMIGTKKANVSLSGQINEVAFYGAAGKNDKFYVANNGSSSSRFRIQGNIQPGASGWTISSNLELGLKNNYSESVTQADPDPNGAIDQRKAEIVFANSTFGTFYIGKGSTASDSTAEVDLSGTGIITYSYPEDVGGGLYFKDKTTGELSTTTQVSSVFDNMDGQSRKSRVRYDTPSLYGFSVGGSAISGNSFDAALKFGNEFGGTKVAAAIAYSAKKGSTSILDGSASVLFPFGLSLTGAAGQTTGLGAGRDNSNFYYLKPGYEFNVLEAGSTAFSVDWQVTRNMQQNDDKARSIGVGFVQNIVAWDLAFYASYHNFDLDRTGSSFDNVNVYAAGFIFKF